MHFPPCRGDIKKLRTQNKLKTRETTDITDNEEINGHNILFSKLLHWFTFFRDVPCSEMRRVSVVHEKQYLEDIFSCKCTCCPALRCFTATQEGDKKAYLLPITTEHTEHAASMFQVNFNIQTKSQPTDRTVTLYHKGRITSNFVSITMCTNSLHTQKKCTVIYYCAH